MKRLAISLALIASLGACATTGGVAPPTPIERADAAVTRAQAAYDRLRVIAEVVMPLVPVSYQSRLLAAQAAAERGLAAARAAVLLADQLAALRRTEAAVAEISSITGS
jgi:hypothetical protein